MTAAALSMTKAAELIGIDRRTLKALTDAGQIPYWFKSPAGRYIYSRSVLEEHQRIAASRHSGAPT